jgi:hypothetical protein
MCVFMCALAPMQRLLPGVTLQNNLNKLFFSSTTTISTHPTDRLFAQVSCDYYDRKHIKIITTTTTTKDETPTAAGSEGKSQLYPTGQRMVQGREKKTEGKFFFSFSYSFHFFL